MPTPPTTEWRAAQWDANAASCWGTACTLSPSLIVSVASSLSSVLFMHAGQLTHTGVQDVTAQLPFALRWCHVEWLPGETRRDIYSRWSSAATRSLLSGSLFSLVVSCFISQPSVIFLNQPWRGQTDLHLLFIHFFIICLFCFALRFDLHSRWFEPEANSQRKWAK